MTGNPVPVDGARWATFDCYGTLVDWDVGIGADLERLFGTEQKHRLLERYHEIEPRVQRANPAAPYRDVMAGVLVELANEAGRQLAPDDEQALARSLLNGRCSPRSKSSSRKPTSEAGSW